MPRIVEDPNYLVNLFFVPRILMTSARLARRTSQFGRQAVLGSFSAAAVVGWTAERRPTARPPVNTARSPLRKPHPIFITLTAYHYIILFFIIINLTKKNKIKKKKTKTRRELEYKNCVYNVQCAVLAENLVQVIAAVRSAIRVLRLVVECECVDRNTHILQVREWRECALQEHRALGRTEVVQYEQG